MTIKAMLFDLDDTLMLEERSDNAAFLLTCREASQRYDVSAEAIHQAVRTQADRLWRTFDTFDYCEAMGISYWEGLWGKFTGDGPNMPAIAEWIDTYRVDAWTAALKATDIDDPEFARQLAERFIVERQKRHVLFPEVERVIKHLCKQHRLGMVTNGVGDIQRDKIDASGLSGYFDPIIISGQFGVGKPDPRIFKLALDEMDVPPGETLMVGNSLERDVKGAQNAGIMAVWINRGNEPAVKGITPDASINDLDGLYELI